MRTHPSSVYEHDEAMDLHAQLCGAEWYDNPPIGDPRVAGGPVRYICRQHQHAYWLYDKTFWCRHAMDGVYHSGGFPMWDKDNWKGSPDVTRTLTHTRTFTFPRTFAGYRPDPPEEYRDKGITNANAGHDYEGVVFSDGTVVLRWMTDYRSHSVWASFADFYQVHGHPEYGTRLEWTDTGDPVDTADMISFGKVS